MLPDLNKTNALEWASHFEKRSASSLSWLSTAAQKFPLEKRRQIVQHIKEGIEEADFHRDIMYGALQIRTYLTQDLWSDIKQTPIQMQRVKQHIEDVALFAATHSPANQGILQDMFFDLVPEDVPESERQLRERMIQMCAKDSCIGE